MTDQPTNPGQPDQARANSQSRTNAGTISHFGDHSQDGTVSQDGNFPRFAGLGRNVAGEEVPRGNQRAEPLPVKHKSGELIFHYKATRHIAGKYEVNQHELEAVLILQVYLWIQGRERVGVAEKEFTDWSGARGRWLKRISKGVRIAIEKGLIERWKFGPGYVIDLTTKGERILEAYNAKFAEIEKRFDDMEKPSEEQRSRWKEMRRKQNPQRIE